MDRVKDLCLVWNNQTLWTDPIELPQCHLVAALYNNEIFQFKNDLNLYVCANKLEIFNFVNRYLRCSLSFEISKNNFGGFKVGDRWTGILSLMDQRKVDFIPHSFSIAYNRSELFHLDFLVPENDLLTILSYPKMVISENPLKMLHCFSWDVWLLIVISFVLLGFVNHCNNSRQCDYFDHWESLYQISLNYLDMFAILVGQSSESVKSSLNLFRNPLHVWMFATFVFRVFYSSDIKAMLLSRAATLVDNFDQLPKLGPDLSILVEANSTTKHHLELKFPNLKAQIVPIPANDVTTIRTIWKLAQTNSVLIKRRDRSEMIQKIYQNQLKLHVSFEGHFTAICNYPISKWSNPVIQKRLGRLFRSLYNTGIAKKLDRKFQYHRPDKTESLDQVMERIYENAYKQIELTPKHDLGVAILLYVYLFGIGLATICLVVEFGCHSFWSFTIIRNLHGLRTY